MSSFSLKDQLFSHKKIVFLADCLQSAYPKFTKNIFLTKVLRDIDSLSLKQCIFCIRENIKTFLPGDYKTSVSILLKALPKECNPYKTDDDFGDFIFAPFNDYVATYGCKKKYLGFSLNALEEMTKRFSCEDAIRFFLNTFPSETLQKMKEWSVSSHYHVRRLASEGSRPKLPWSQKIDLNSYQVIHDILDNLFCDNTRYVVRSVANHLNDISKINSDLVIKTLHRWKCSQKQTQKEMDYLTKHALRTLIKKGNGDALMFLGYSLSPCVQVSDLSIRNTSIFLGDSLDFSFSISAHESELLMIDYNIYFKMKNGSFSTKTFKIKKIHLKKGEEITISKSHKFREMTTKKLYKGDHFIELQINGNKERKHQFFLKT